MEHNVSRGRCWEPKYKNPMKNWQKRGLFKEFYSRYTVFSLDHSSYTPGLVRLQLVPPMFIAVTIIAVKIIAVMVIRTADCLWYSFQMGPNCWSSTSSRCQQRLVHHLSSHPKKLARCNIAVSAIRYNCRSSPTSRCRCIYDVVLFFTIWSS